MRQPGLCRNQKRATPGFCAPRNDIKSIKGEETFLQDTEDRKVMRACLREQAADISGRLKRRRLGAHTEQQRS